MRLVRSFLSGRVFGRLLGRNQTVDSAAAARDLHLHEHVGQHASARRGRSIAALLLSLGVGGAFVGLALSCTPQNAALAVPAARAACVLLHALAEDGRVDSICATAEELAPIVTELLEERSVVGGPEGMRARDGGAPATSRATLAVALQPVAELATPRRRVPRRRCVAWAPVASSGDAGKAPDAAAEGHDEAGSGHP